MQLNPKTSSELADYSITYGDRVLDLASPKVMGIINATSDSFYANSRVGGISAFLKKAEQMISEGAYIIDLGAFSSRPTAKVIEEAVEWSILEPLIQAFITEFPQIPLSIDTFRSNIAVSVTLSAVMAAPTKSSLPGQSIILSFLPFHSTWKTVENTE